MEQYLFKFSLHSRYDVVWTWHLELPMSPTPMLPYTTPKHMSIHDHVNNLRIIMVLFVQD